MMSTRNPQEKHHVVKNLSLLNSLTIATFSAAALLTLFLSACGFPAWRDQMMQDVMERRLRVDPATVGPAGQPSQTIEFYDASGRHTGYGKVQGGTVELFNADSSRTGFGKTGR